MGRFPPSSRPKSSVSELIELTLLQKLQIKCRELADLSKPCISREVKKFFVLLTLPIALRIFPSSHVHPAS